MQSAEKNTAAAENVSIFLKISVPLLLKLSVRTSLKDMFNVNIVNTSSNNENTLWCRFSNFFQKDNEPLILGSTYSILFYS